MRTLILSTAAALAIAAVPAFAQQVDPTSANSSTAANGTAPSQTQTETPAAAPAGSASTAADTTPDSGATTTTGTSVTTGAGSGYEFQGASAAPAAPQSYPLCSAKIQDECINPREAGKNWGNRPLKYWPGKPASEL